MTMKLTVEELKKIIKEQMEEAGGIGGTPAPRGRPQRIPYLILDEAQAVIGCIVSSSSKSEEALAQWRRTTLADEPGLGVHAHQTDVDGLKEELQNELDRLERTNVAVIEMKRALGTPVPIKTAPAKGPRAAGAFLSGRRR